jgi:hypothetical protein
MKRPSILAVIFSLAFVPALVANQSHHDKSGASTLTGCLSGPTDAGVYTLKTASKSVEVGGSADLKSHVGHKVKLTGSWAKSGADIGEKEKTTEKTEKGERHFKVTGIEHIADSCSSAAAKSDSSKTK